jgi:hypothetical protein
MMPLAAFELPLATQSKNADSKSLKSNSIRGFGELKRGGNCWMGAWSTPILVSAEIDNFADTCARGVSGGTNGVAGGEFGLLGFGRTSGSLSTYTTRKQDSGLRRDASSSFVLLTHGN